MVTTPLREALQQVEAEIAAGRPGEALRLCDQLLGQHPRWLDAQRLRARALVALDRLPEAEGVLDGILASNPEDGDAFCDRAYLMQRRGELLGALACYRRACELLRSNTGLRAAHNQLAAQLGRPPYTPSHTGLARLYLRAELFAHALREWDIALQANPNRLDAQIGMAETLWRSGDDRRAQATSRYILQHMPLCLKPLLLLAFFELAVERAEEAQQLVNLAGEMDPEQRVAGELFGDLVAGGNVALAQLFRAAVRSKTSPLAVPVGNDSQTGVFPAITPMSSRPISEPLPTGQLATGPLFTASKPDYEALPTGKLPYPPDVGNGHNTIEDFFSQSRASMLPDHFDKVFRETEYMLWSRDNEEPITAEIPAITTDTPPPASAPDDADMGFVRWLQEQGAHPLNGATPPAPALAAPSPLPALPPSPSEPVGLPPFLAQALAEAAPAATPPLRAVERAAWPDERDFADDENQPVTDALSVVPPADQLPALPPSTDDPPATHEAALPLAHEAPAEPTRLPAPPITPPPAMEMAPVSPSVSATSDPGVAPTETPPASITTPDATTSDEARPLTIEAIQHGLESAGFARLETGRLAAVASSLNPTVQEAPTPTLDVAQQLEAARALRRNGRLGEALVEYRALVKAATDRMPDFIRDLRDAAIEAPQEPEVHRLLGDAYIREGDYVEALEAYNRASQLRQDEVGR